MPRLSNGLYPNLSRTQIAKDVGKTPGAISLILAGKRKPTLELAVEIARMAGVSVDRFHKQIEERQVLWARELKSRRRTNRNNSNSNSNSNRSTL